MKFDNRDLASAKIYPVDQSVGWGFDGSGQGLVSYVSSPGRPALDPGDHISSHSAFLARDKAENILDAAFHAIALGLPLNRFITIDWQLGGVKAQFHKATARFLKLAADWLRVQGCKTAHVWVREISSKSGEHVHLLIHVPSKLAKAFAYRQRGWLKRCGVVTYRKGVIRSKPVGRSYRHALVGVQGGECYAGHLARVLGYMLKTAAPETRRRLGVRHAAPPVRMSGKRAGTSENLGREARKWAVRHTPERTQNCSRVLCPQWRDLRRSTDVRCAEHPGVTSCDDGRDDGAVSLERR